MKTSKILVASLTMGMACFAVSAATYYVSPDGAGTSYTAREPGPLAGAAEKVGNGDELVLKRGLYHLPTLIGSTSKTDGAQDYLKFANKTGLIVRSEDGDRSGTVIYGDGEYGTEGVRAAYFHGQMTFCGLTVSNFYGNWGGALTAQNATISNCLFVCNHSKGVGGAVRYGTIVDCEFISNVADDEGGAIAYAGLVSNCVFRLNTAAKSGAIAANGTVVRCCEFYSNSVPQWNGGVSYANGKTATFYDCLFDGNSAGWGGAVAHEGGGSLTTYDCVFIGNSATTGPISQNCTHYRAKFIRNFNKGGRTVVSSLAYNATLVDCEFIDNYDTSARTFTASSGYMMNYRYATKGIPTGDVKYPLFILMHGAGERGSDNAAQLGLFAGLINWLDANMEGYFLIAGQVPANEQWVDVPWGAASGTMPENPSGMMSATMELVDDLMANEAIDANRVYVTGMSMGGYGVWDILSRRGDLFAAAMPLCGGGDPAQVAQFKDVSVWAFHGSADGTVPVARTREMVAAMENAGATPRYTEYAGAGHDVWTATYANADALAWFVQRKKGEPWTAEQDAAYEAGGEVSPPEDDEEEGGGKEGGEGGGGQPGGDSEPVAEDVTNIPNGIYVSATADGEVAHACTYADPGTLKQGVSKIADNSVLVLMRGDYDIPAMFTSPTKTDGAYDYIKLTGKSGVTVRSIDNDPKGTVLYGDGTYGSEGLRLLYSKLSSSTYCGLTVSNFYGNWGGAITFHGGETVSNCFFRCNKSKGIGGACRNGRYVKCMFDSNVAEGEDGGGALAYPGKVTDSTFFFNTAKKAGAILASANMSVELCQFYTNSATSANGGVFYMNKAAATVTFQSCRFEGNAGSWGGALAVDSGVMNTYDCWFVGNTSASGAASQKGNHYNAKFIGNYSSNGSGVVFNGGVCSNCEFIANVVVAKSDGASIGKGGTYRNCRVVGNTVNQYVFRDATLYDCYIADNVSSGWFGPNACTSYRCVFSNNTAAAYACLVNGTAYNCLYVGNKITSNYHASWGKLYNCTFANNVGTAMSGLSECKNVLAFGNTVDFQQDSAKYTYCQYKTAKSQYAQDIVLTGVGCKQIADPKFADADDLHPYGCGLKKRSPAVGAGDPSIWTVSDVDLANQPRLTGGAVAVGCYEYVPKKSGLILLLR